jgi:ketosteroid isomerase-like protein
MRAAIFATALLLATAAHAAEDMSIQRVIAAQIDAFRHDDAPAAFSYASPRIQALFGDAPHFLAAVRRNYAPVYRPRSFSFGPLTDSNGTQVQHVDIIGPQGEGEEALYFMEHEPDGSWRIAGCQLVVVKRLEV